MKSQNQSENASGKYIKLTITPDSNVDYKAMSVIEGDLVFTITCGHQDPLPVQKDGISYIYSAYDLDINEHRLIWNNVPHRILHRLTVG